MKTAVLFFIVTVSMGLGTILSRAAENIQASRQIDAILAKEWKSEGIKPNAPASDEIFLRRVYLDVIGRIPTYEEALDFLDSKDTAKRSKLIDKLLNSDGYSENFFNYWADILRAQSNGAGADLGAQAYLNYIRESLRNNKPYDQLVRELLSTNGDCFETGAVGYYLRDRGMPLDNLSNTTRAFLGTRMECAQCHNHPFDRWTQMDFYKMAAFTHNMAATNYRSPAQTEVSKLINQDKSLDKETQDMARRAVSEAFRPLQTSTVVQNKGKLQLPHDYKYPDAKPKEAVTAAVMFGKEVPLAPESSPIEEFGKWVTSSENPRFTNVIANRLWKKVFGLALIEPLDELLDTTKSSNPELMKFLETQMVALKYDMKAYLRMLLNTQTYQRECSTEDVAPGTVYHFPGPTFRRMTAEQTWDSMVALINPWPDEKNWTQRERERRELENRKRLAKMLDATEPQLLFEAGTSVAGVMKEQNKQFDEMRKQLEVARKDNDKETIKKIQSALNDTQRTLRLAISKCFYEAAQKSNNETVKHELAEACSGGPMEMAMMNLMGNVSVNVSDVALDPKLQEQLKHEEETLGLKDAKAVKAYETYRRGLHQTWCRASELPSPAPRGHFLREFGQSDRDTTENSSDEASVPQALTIMNGQLVTQMGNGYAALMANLNRAQTAEEKIDTIYLSLYARRAKAAERAALLKAIEASAGSKTIWEDMILGAISTRQFIFIQ